MLYPNSRFLWWTAARFLLVLVVLQFAWSQARGTALERAVIDHATVGTAVGLIRMLDPQLPVVAQGARISAPGGGVNVLNGCEGTEVLFLLLAALVAAPLSLRARALGVLLGTVWVFALNQLRVVALFFSFRSDRALFDQLHGLVAPLLLIVLVLAFFVLLLQWDVRGQPGVAPGEPG